MKHSCITRVTVTLLLTLITLTLPGIPAPALAAAPPPAPSDTALHIRLFQHVLELMRAGQGDSVHALLNAQMRAAVPAAQLSPMFAQLEMQLGALEKTSTWRVDHIGALQIYCCDLTFPRATLRMLTAFDPDGLMNTLRFVPVQTPPAQPAPVPADSGLREQPLTVTCGTYRLPGTLTLPEGTGPFPCLILVHGSGPQDRDCTTGPNKPFRDIAHGLARRGIASIRYDKRTFVYRTMPDSVAITPDYETVDDALAAIDLAATLPVIDTAKIFIAGHSFGGQMLPRIVSRSPRSLAGAILLSAPARDILTLMDIQLRYLASLGGGTPDSAAVAQQLAMLRAAAPDSYWDYLERYDPAACAARLTIPLLVIQGGRDYQVTETDFSLWRKALSANPRATFRYYPSLNHIYQPGTAPSSPDEYTRPLPVDSALISNLADWILAR